MLKSAVGIGAAMPEGRKKNRLKTETQIVRTVDSACTVQEHRMIHFTLYCLRNELAFDQDADGFSQT